MKFLVLRPRMAHVSSFVASNGYLTACATINIGETKEDGNTEGTPGVDVFDDQTRKAVWNGWVENPIFQSVHRDSTYTIKSAASNLFESLAK